MSNPFSLPNSHQNHLLSSSYGFLRFLWLAAPSSSTFLPQKSSETLWDTWSDSHNDSTIASVLYWFLIFVEKVLERIHLREEGVIWFIYLEDFSPSWIGALVSRNHIEAPHLYTDQEASMLMSPWGHFTFQPECSSFLWEVFLHFGDSVSLWGIRNYVILCGHKRDWEGTDCCPCVFSVATLGCCYFQSEWWADKWN